MPAWHALRRGMITLLLAAVGGAIVGAPPAAADADLPPVIGLNAGFGPTAAADRPALATLIRSSGARIARSEFSWKHVERTPGNFDWRGLDNIVEVAARHQIVLLPLLQR